MLQLSLLVTIFIRYGNSFTNLVWWQHIVSFTWLFIVWCIVFYAWDLYSLIRKWSHKNYFFAIVMNVFISMGLFYIVPQFGITPKTNLILQSIIFTVLFYFWRFIFNKVFNYIGHIKNVVIIGGDENSLLLVKSLHKNHKLGYKPVAILLDKEINKPEEIINKGTVLFRDIEKLEQFISQNEIHTVVISENWYQSIKRNLYDLIPQKINFYNISSFWEEYNRTIPIYATNEIWFLENLRGSSKEFFEVIKRLEDILLSLIMLPIILPLSIIAAFLVKITSKGPILYSQIRIGKGGKEYRIYKFRSMKIDAEKYGAQWSTKNDPRVTKVGRFLRATRIDEFPQLFNVLKGDMSLIGPRPERPEFVKELVKQIPHYNLRHLVKPGLTGWAQVNMEYTDTISDTGRKLEYDLYYLKNRNPILDFKILLKTVMTVFTGSGR